MAGLGPGIPDPDFALQLGENIDSQEQLRAEQENNLLLQEAVADLELALEDVGWRASPPASRTSSPRTAAAGSPRCAG
jgi:hypothetical protein